MDDTMNEFYDVIVRTSPKDPPKEFELSAAQIIADYFCASVVFRRQEILKTPDLLIRGQVWELKSPRGNGKNTIHNSFKTARAQSDNIVIDLRRCKLHERKALANIRYAYRNRKRKTGEILIIKKSGKVIDVADIV
ncbi:hypothetical protein IJ117_02515 [Candidatus Saccharibacteria bacterium]|nr:hypothetical protein [Candidatus Saccharibacteria bacterium]